MITNSLPPHSEELFLRDVKDHRVFIIRDEGRSRHIRFKKPGSSYMYFDLITWPGHLCYVGDMGAYAFRCLDDGFAFFREPPAPATWAEKLVAVDSACGVRQYSPAKFRKIVNEAVAEWVEKEDIHGDRRSELLAAVTSEVLNFTDCGIIRAYQAACEFKHGSFSFSNFFEYDLTEFTDRYIWCCCAIPWGVDKYEQYRA